MGRYIYPNVCFGWIEPNNEKEIDLETLEELSEKYDIEFTSFCTFANHGVKCDSIYGVLCDFDKEKGVISISEESKNKVKKIYNLWKIKNNIQKDYEIGIHLVILGEMESYKTDYTFDLD